MVVLTNSDYQFMAEENYLNLFQAKILGLGRLEKGVIVGHVEEARQNREKYLEMLNTKIFVDDSYKSLSFGSNKRVEVICPFCGEHRFPKFSNTEKVGHTLCNSCSHTIRSYGSMIGETFGRWFLLSFGEQKSNGNKKESTFRAICKCGTEKQPAAATVKTGTSVSCGCYNREISKSRFGPLNGNWSFDLTEEERKEKRRGHAAWARNVKERDDFTCQVCGSRNNVVAHHLESYADNKELRNDINNGIVLCDRCHTDFHINFMGSYHTPCTAADFDFYLMQV